MNIIPVIRDLLLRNQKAVVPDFGTFYMVQRPAQLNKATRVLTPPGVTVKFDRNQKQDDGQLTGYLVRKLKQDKDVVLQAISDFTKSTEQQLHNIGFVTLEGFGTLEKKRSGDISFIPEEELLKRISLVDLPKISVPGTPVDKTPPPPPVVTHEYPAATYTGRRKWWIPAALLILLVGLVSVIYFSGNMDLLVADIRAVFGGAKNDSTEQLVFGNSVGQEEPSSDTLREQISRELDEQVDREKALAYNEKTRDNTGIEEETTTPVVRTAGPGMSKPFHIIAGSFTIIQNAEKQKESLDKKGFPAEILPKDGSFYMISLGSYNTIEEAATARKQMEQSLSKELWVKKRIR